MREFDLKKEDIPSYYKMTINRPKMVAFDVDPVANLPMDFLTTTVDVNATEETVPDDTIVPVPALSATSFIADIEKGKAMEFSEAFDMLAESNNNKNLKASKIDGCYDDYIFLMAQKLDKKNNLVASINLQTNLENSSTLIDEKSDIIIIDSYDGVQHRLTQKDRTNIVSFSSQMITSESIKAGYSTAVSRNILTWQQMIGKESYANMMHILEPIYERKEAILNNIITIESNIINKKSKVTLYDLHDGKRLYLLTQYSLFN